MSQAVASIFKAATLFLVTGVLSQAAYANLLRVGVYHNPPKIFLNESGQLSGIFGELIEAIADGEEWQLDVLECEWNECLSLLEHGELDLMPDVAWTASRAERFSFHQEPVLHSWSQLYRSPELEMNEIFDLEQRRIAVLEGSQQQGYLLRLMKDYGVEGTLVGVSNYQEGFSSVMSGEADAVVSNHLLGGWQATRYGLVASPIMFQPTRLFFAVSLGQHEQLLNRIDLQLIEWKRQPGSPFYKIIERWQQGIDARVPSWVILSLVIGALLLASAMLSIMLLRRSIRRHLFDVRQAHEDTRRLELHDSLTGLPNRRYLWGQLRQRMREKHERAGFSALILINLDRFRRVNDGINHHAGDKLLLILSARFQTLLGDYDAFLSHLGADEFAILVNGLNARYDQAAAQVEHIGERLISSIVASLPPEAADMGVTGSIGVTLFDGVSFEPDEALKQADMALDQAKNHGGNQLRFLDDSIRIYVGRQLQLETDLRRALDRDQMRIYYQVQVSHRKEVSGVEALLRWEHPQHGMISPMEFIPLAEKTGLIIPIGRWVIEAACYLLDSWKNHPEMSLYAISVNVSAIQLRDDGFVDELKSILVYTGAPSRRLVLEVTESSLMHDPEEVGNRLSEISQLGVRLALDDFGTGYSSLNYLKRLSLHELKIDASFVSGVPEDLSDMAIVDTILTLANRLGLEVTAEGVETEEQFRWLKNRNCKRFQGYLFGRPQPLGENGEPFRQPSSLLLR